MEMAKLYKDNHNLFVMLQHCTEQSKTRAVWGCNHEEINMQPYGDLSGFVSDCLSDCQWEKLTGPEYLFSDSQSLSLCEHTANISG